MGGWSSGRGLGVERALALSMIQFPSSMLMKFPIYFSVHGDMTLTFRSFVRVDSGSLMCRNPFLFSVSRLSVGHDNLIQAGHGLAWRLRNIDSLVHPFNTS